MLTTRNTKREQCYEKRDYVTVEIKNQDGHDYATETRVLDNKDGSYKSFGKKKLENTVCL